METDTYDNHMETDTHDNHTMLVTYVNQPCVSVMIYTNMYYFGCVSC